MLVFYFFISAEGENLHHITRRIRPLAENSHDLAIAGFPATKLGEVSPKNRAKLWNESRRDFWRMSPVRLPQFSLISYWKLGLP